MVKQTLKKASKTTKKTMQKVDYYPNKMGLAVAALASVSLVLLALLAMM